MTIPLVPVLEPVPLRTEQPEPDFQENVVTFLDALPDYSEAQNAQATAMNATAVTINGQADAVAADKATAQGLFNAVEELTEGLLSSDLGVMIGNSATETTIGTGTKSFAATAGKLWRVDLWALIYSAANPTNWMAGPVTAYDMSDGNPLTVDVRTKNGAGTFTDWVICPTMPTVETSGLIPLASGTISSAVATVDIVAGFDNTKYTEYELHLRNFIGSASAQLYLRTSGNGGSSFSAGASDYIKPSSTAAAQIELTNASIVPASTDADSAGANLVVRIFTTAGKNTMVHTVGTVQGDATSVAIMALIGMRDSSTAANAVRLFMSSGNIASGEYALFAVRKS